MSVTPTYTGATVLDERGQRIGDVRDVIYDQDEQQPKWLVVRTGRFRGQHYVPSAGSYRTEASDIVVPYSVEQVNSAPKAGGAHVLSAAEQAELGRHYHLEGKT